MVARTIPERREEYLALHRAVWPAVEHTIVACGIRNFTIFVRGDVLFGYFEYVGDDYATDQLRMAADPVTREWWAHTGPCQVPFDAGSDAPNWVELDEVWHLD